MKTSDQGIALIKEFESLRLAPYHDPIGLPTVGVGHLLSREKWADLSQWPTITRGEADDLLRDDIRHHEMAVSRSITAPLSQGQFDALASFTFNLGAGALRASTLRRVLNLRDYPEVPAQLRRWVFAGGRRLRGLERRREAEILIGSPWEAPDFQSKGT